MSELNSARYSKDGAPTVSHPLLWSSISSARKDSKGVHGKAHNLADTSGNSRADTLAMRAGRITAPHKHLPSVLSTCIIPCGKSDAKDV